MVWKVHFSLRVVSAETLHTQLPRPGPLQVFNLIGKELICLVPDTQTIENPDDQ